tara:strand:- start:977 stop:2137 length:1161 start_codon:yes stop_codon:yes gene_type:complete
MNRKLSADEVLNEVIAETGLDDFGDSPFLEDYRRALDTLNAEVKFSKGGIAAFRDVVKRSLTNWLLMQKDIRNHPEILDEELAPPVVVTGFVRSGTTKLQRMLSVCPKFQSLELWKVTNPAPFPGTNLNIKDDPRIPWTDAMVKGIHDYLPEFFASHPFGTHQAEEDLALQEITFKGPSLPMSMGARHFKEELSPISDEVYEFIKTCLKYFQWQDRTTSNKSTKPWVLKTPLHLGNIATISRVFPGAKIIHTHRDALTSVTSCARLEELAARRFTDKLDLHYIGDGVLSYWSKEWERNIEDREKLEQNDYLDVHFDDINKNSLELINRVFDFLGIEFDQTSRDAIQDWENNNERHKFGRNRYDKEDFGFTEDRVKQAFQKYFDYFG